MSVNIAINGNTYNGIDSVSVNGNTFGVSSGYTEEVLRRNFDPNGTPFMDTVAINMANGDYVEAQFDNSNASAGNCVFSVGTNIHYYPNPSTPGTNIMIYSKQYSDIYYSIGCLTIVNGSRLRTVCKTKSQTGNKTKIKITGAGIYFDDELILPSEYTNVDSVSSRDTVFETIATASTLQIGADQSDATNATAYYDYIKVFRRN